MKYFIDNYELEYYQMGGDRELHYLNGPAGLFAIMVKQGSTETMYYVHKDYLGSISAITDASGNLVESLSYDPWGRRRNPLDWTDYNVTSTLFDRGFTGHEHLDQFGLINMNGRVYDPFLARFLSPDPFIQAPGYTQNYNRYSYAWNNPLKYTDPDGEFVHIIVGAIIGGYINLIANAKKIEKPWQMFTYFGVGALAGGLGAGIGAGFGSLAAGAKGFSMTAASGLSVAGFFPGAAAGAGAGFTSGFVTGTGNSLVEGENLKHSLGKGLQSGAWGLAIGGLTGGIQGGIRAARAGNNFWSGNGAGGKYGVVPQVNGGRLKIDGGFGSINHNSRSRMNPVSIDGYVPSTWDNVTDMRISELHPRVRSTAARFINKAQSELDLKIRISQGLRSIAEQDALYEQGRTIAGNIVTNLKGGYSYHNYGLAFDVVGMSNGAVNYNIDWHSLGNLGVSMGLEWGGNFTSFIDRPHFQMTFGHTIQDLLKINF